MYEATKEYVAVAVSVSWVGVVLNDSSYWSVVDLWPGSDCGVPDVATVELSMPIGVVCD